MGGSQTGRGRDEASGEKNTNSKCKMSHVKLPVDSKLDSCLWQRVFNKNTVCFNLVFGHFNQFNKIVKYVSFYRHLNSYLSVGMCMNLTFQ